MKISLLVLALLAPPPPRPLKFDHMLLGNVVRVLSAHFHTTIALYGSATAPITGDFSALTLDRALAAVAGQARLEVNPLGAKPADGYALRPAPPDDGKAAALAAAARRRAELLQLRAKLERSPPPNPAQDQVPHAD